jgi:hypothetical protein
VLLPITRRLPHSSATNVRAAINTCHNHRMPMWITSDIFFYGAFRMFNIKIKLILFDK